jgi:hypothetical protein
VGAANAFGPLPVLCGVVIISRCRHFFVGMIRLQALFRCRRITKIERV